MNGAWDVVVVGGGAAGIFAAMRSAARGRRTLLLEKNRRPGVKILMSGGTRCNLTHDCDRRGIVEAFGPRGRFLHSSLAPLGPRELVGWFHQAGVPTKVEPGGKIFPVSDRAADVLAALLRELSAAGAELAPQEPLRELLPSPSGFVLRTDARELRARQVIVTTGGCSYPGCGTTGDGYAWARALGHTVIPPRPALVPLTSEAGWVRELQGLTIPDVQLEIRDPAAPRGKPLDTRRGSLLFTHFGLSGPVAMNAGRAVSGHPEPGRLTALLDFLPERKREALLESWRALRAAEGRKPLAALLPLELPQRLRAALFARAGVPPETRLAEASKEMLRCLAGVLKECPVPLSGTRGFRQAEVTAGGVALEEVDSRNLRSRLVPGLFFAGEVLDLDGPIGGFNFQAAFSTGFLAGECVD